VQQTKLLQVMLKRALVKLLLSKIYCEDCKEFILRYQIFANNQSIDITSCQGISGNKTIQNNHGLSFNSCIAIKRGFFDRHKI
jgi:hypothetical protein